MLLATATLPQMAPAASTNVLNGALVQVAPSGNLVYALSTSNIIAEGIDCNAYVVNLDSAQTISM